MGGERGFPDLDLERDLGAVLDMADMAVVSDYGGIGLAAAAVGAEDESVEDELTSSEIAMEADDDEPPELIEVGSDDEDVEPSAKKYRLASKRRHSMLHRKGRHNMCFGKRCVGVLMLALYNISESTRPY